MATLERAIQIAAEAHAGQVDKGGAPYILHPLRVMMAMETEDERIAAVLQPLGMVALGRGEVEAARGYLSEALSMAREIGNQREIAAALGRGGDAGALPI